MRRLLLAFLLFQAMASPLKAASATSVPSPIWGVTLDDLTKLDAIVESLVKLPHKPTVRVVFDVATSAQDYQSAVATLHRNAYVVGEIMDSSYFPTTLGAYAARTQELVSVLGPNVDIWEIGNEINGEWLRQDPNGPDSVAASEEQQIGQMMLSGYNIVKAAGGKVMVTLYYNQDPSGANCWRLPMDSWRTWAGQFLPSDVRDGVDYAMFSYYPYKDCPGLSPDWARDFYALETIFPRARVGFGEIGTSKINAPWSVQSNLIETYYPMVNAVKDPRFVGGFFWWNYVEEMLPYNTSPYWRLLYQTISRRPRSGAPPVGVE